MLFRSHLLVADTSVCATKCREEYGNPCEKFCPAAVYERVPKGNDPGDLRLQINFANCVHCKTCDVTDPYQIITWVTPEGGRAEVRRFVMPYGRQRHGRRTAAISKPPRSLARRFGTINDAVR